MNETIKKKLERTKKKLFLKGLARLVCCLRNTSEMTILHFVFDARWVVGPAAKEKP